MSVRDELAAYTIDGADEARRMGSAQARRDWPRLPDADAVLGAASRAYERSHRSVRRRLNRTSFVAAFAIAHLQTLIDLDERPPARRPHFHRGRS